MPSTLALPSRVRILRAEPPGRWPASLDCRWSAWGTSLPAATGVTDRGWNCGRRREDRPVYVTFLGGRAALRRRGAGLAGDPARAGRWGEVGRLARGGRHAGLGRDAFVWPVGLPCHDDRADCRAAALLRMGFAARWPTAGVQTHLGDRQELIGATPGRCWQLGNRIS